MRNILIVTYYWPPAGGIEVHRVVKFCKYLPEFGYRPMVLTVRGGTASASDETLVSEVSQVEPVVKAPSLEPHALYNALRGGKQRASGGKASSPLGSNKGLGEFIRLNVFVPDARIGWMPFAVRDGKKMLQEFPPDVIFSTAPPYTVHLIAARLARKAGCPWVADFRDPWVENYAYNTCYRFPWVKGINGWMERRVLNRADRVVVATPGQQRLQGAKANDGETRFRTITNGYDFQDLREGKPQERFFLSYFGSMSAQRVPVELFEVLRDAIQEDPAFAEAFCFRFAGRVTPEAREKIEKILPEANMEWDGMLSHEVYGERVADHQALLVLVDQVPHNEIIIPAKCFEMMTTGNPMLAIGPEGGGVEELFRSHEAGLFVPYGDREQMKKTVLELFDRWKQGALNTGARHVDSFRRRTLTGELAKVLDEVVEG